MKVFVFSGVISSLMRVSQLCLIAPALFAAHTQGYLNSDWQASAASQPSYSGDTPN